MKVMGLTDLLEQRGDAKKIVKMTVALPLLPADKTLEGFDCVVDLTVRNDLDVELQEYLDYVENTWIIGMKIN